MNCLECQPEASPVVGVCGRCGAGLCAEHLIESDERLTFNMPIRVPVPVSAPARKLRCARCAAAEAAQEERRSA
jgi:hypothetical protein